MQSVDGSQKINLEAKLDVVILNPNEKVQMHDENKEVIENYYRVKSSEVLT